MLDELRNLSDLTTLSGLEYPVQARM